MNPASPFRRLFAAHWALALVLALFLLAGALTLGDYGYWRDTRHHRAIGNVILDYLAGDGERAFDQLSDTNPQDRYYGAAFETPLVIVERILDLERGRDIRLSRHLLTHLFFLVGGVFCYLLVLRMCNSRALALVATALFLLHPRIYAHSFFNSKDVPFLVAFMIALYLMHRAFRRDTLGAFLLCGVGVGLLANLRIMGIGLFIAVLALRALDLGESRERRRVLLTGGAFALAAILTYYASLPVLWTDPFGRFAELVRTFGAHPSEASNLFRGEWLYAPDGPPFDYVPVWVGITTPPATLLLALLGAVALAWRALRRPRHALRNGPLRFGLLLAALPVATTVAAVVLESNVYHAWRQLYFLYAPLLLLAAFGLWRLASVPRGRWMRTGAYALTAAAVAVTVASMVRIHPHQNNHFNSLVDRTTPERLNSLYTVIFWRHPNAAVFDAIRRDHPSGDVFLSLNHVPWYSATLPVAETNDFRSGERNFYAVYPWGCSAAAPAPPRYLTRVYATTLHCVVDPVAWFGGYRREARSTEPLNAPASPSAFAVHRVGDVLVYVRDGCSEDDMEAQLYLRVHPVAPGDPTGYGFARLDFPFAERGVRIDGDCVAVMPLPDYAIARIEAGRFTPERAEAALRAVAGDEPLARSRFTVWRAGQGLVYARERCAAEDGEARFFLHVVPFDGADLPVWRQRSGYGFDNLNFAFPEYGVRTGAGRCIVTVPLPAYPIARIETGQFDGGGQIWEARFAFALPDVDAEALAREPLARSVYDVHLDGRTLTYVRDGCTDAEANAQFFLHVVPADAGDLPEQRREHGFDNLDFTLAARGARIDGNCVAVTHLPDYPIATIRTGQYDDAGALWTVEFALPDGE